MRKLMWVSLGFGAACGLYAFGCREILWLIGAIALVLCVAAFLIRKRWKLLRVAAAVLLGITLGVCWTVGYGAWRLDEVRQVDRQIVSLRVVASDYSYKTDYGVAVEGETELDGKRYHVLIYLEGEVSVTPGDVIEGKFRLRDTNRSGDPTHHRGNGIQLLAYPRGEVEHTHSSVPLKFYPAVMRHGLIETLEDAFPSDTAFFAKALLLGDRSDVDYEMNTAFKISGISHIIAVSGLHVSILFSLVMLLCGKRRVLTALAGIPILILFAAVAGFTPSITRACLMQILVLLAVLFDREYDPPTSLAFAVLVMLVANPMVITSVSFQLSVGCMAGIFLFSGRIGSWMQELHFWKSWEGKSLRGRFRQWISSGVSVTLSAMFFTTPLVAYHFGAVSLVGVLTNLLVLWVVSLIFYGIMAVCLLAFIWKWGASSLAWLLSWPIRYVLGVAKCLSSVPLGAVYTRSIYIVLWLVLCYALLAVFLICKKRNPKLLIGCCALSLCVALCCSWAEPLMDDCRMTVLDVGQGQCILLQAQGKNYLIDCGGDSDTATADLAAETLLSQGISRLDGVIVTHFDRDHAGGVEYLLTRMEVDAVYLPDVGDGGEIADAIFRRSGDAAVLVQEDLVLSWADTSITVFAPILSGSDNESGLCVLFRGKNCDILITGDLSGFGERLLLREKQIPKLTAIVAGHHGSKHSTTDALLDATNPEYAFISVGDGNQYDHPSNQVIDRLVRHGCGIYRTDHSGTIVFRR